MPDRNLRIAAVHDREAFPVKFQEVGRGLVGFPCSVLSKHKVSEGKGYSFGAVRKSEHGRFLRWCFLEATRRLARPLTQSPHVNLSVIFEFRVSALAGRLNTQIIDLAHVSAFANPANRTLYPVTP